MATQEIELKLKIARRDIDRLREHPAIVNAQLSPPTVHHLISIYYDSPTYELLQKGISLRVRNMDGGWFQSIKSTGHVQTGLHARMEWEDLLSKGAPDFNKITEPALLTIFDSPSFQKTLTPIFVTDVQRSEWQLQLANGHIEMALDDGHLRINEQALDDICEVELELKSGKADQLFAFALSLHHAIPMEIENISKAELGYRHLRPTKICSVKARKVHLDQSLSPTEAFHKLVWTCLEQLQSNHPAILAALDFDAIHHMRVAMRRIRSAIEIFRRTTDKSDISPILSNLRWINQTLGEARDLEVLLADTLPQSQTVFGDHPGFLVLKQNALAAQKKSYRRICNMIHSQRYQSTLLQLALWLSQEEHFHHEKDTLLTFAKKSLSRQHKKMMRDVANLDTMTPEEQHKVRLRGKKLRHSVEFFGDLFKDHEDFEAAFRSYLTKLIKLLNRLGLTNDVTVSETLIYNLTCDYPTDEVAEMWTIFISWNFNRAAYGIHPLQKATHKFLHCKEFWHQKATKESPSQP